MEARSRFEATATATGRDDDAKQVQTMQVEDAEEWAKRLRDGAGYSTDPFSCLCCCNFRKLGQSYILYQDARRLVIVGPHWGGVVVTLILIAVATGIFLQRQCTFLPWQFTLLTLFLSGSTTFFLLRTALSDPGIITKRECHGEDQEEMARLVADDLKEPDHFYSPSQRRRFCDICDLSQSPGTIHCEDCGVCIEDHDHHCPWMGKCIGKKNQASFRVFNLCWVVYLLFVLVTSLFALDWDVMAARSGLQIQQSQRLVMDPESGRMVNITTLRGADRTTVIKTEIIFTNQQQQHKQLPDDSSTDK